ncbi:MAG: hypothetical protein WAZ21_04575 [Candidatus Saccharimonadales bacterium]
MFDWVSLNDVYNNLLATLIWVAFAGVIGLIFRARIARFIRRILPQIDSSIPHVDFSMNYNVRGDYKTDIAISNNGGEPAYNVYVFLYSKSFVSKNDYSLKSLGGDEVRSGVLGITRDVNFIGVELIFDGCSLTTKEEIWVEYDNAAGVHFRTVVTPPTPRGDSIRVNPPKVIKKRLEMMPEYHTTRHDSEWKKFEKGKYTLFPKLSLIGRIRYLIKDRLRVPVSMKTKSKQKQ